MTGQVARALDGIPGAAQAADAVAAGNRAQALDAFTSGFHTLAWIAAGLALTGAALSWLLVGRERVGRGGRT